MSKKRVYCPVCGNTESTERKGSTTISAESEGVEMKTVTVAYNCFFCDTVFSIIESQEVKEVD